MIMATIIMWLDKFFYSFTTEAQYERQQRELHNFLSQATDRIHLEQLEREWDRRHSSQAWR